MTRTTLFLAAALALTSPAVLAQEAPPPADEAPSLMERGAELFLRGLMNEMEPSLREMEGALKEMQPEVQKLLDLMGDIRNYEMPEKLPNGDILIRRKPTLPAPPKEGEVEL